jgi:hypothetical protein
MTKKINNYEERIVLFLDILGFKELINDSIVDVERFQKIQTTIRVIRLTFNITQKSKDRTITQFSDSLVVSFKITEAGEVAFLLWKTNELLRKLILKGIVCRGGIAKGKLIHNDIYMFGPAFLEAYILESKIAIFPRVIIADKSIISIGIDNYGFHPAYDKEFEKSEINSLIKLDFDGFYYVDYFNFETKWEMSTQEKTYVNKLHELINEWLNSNKKNLYLTQKYQWMKNKFNEVVERLKIDNRIEVGGIKIGSEKKSGFYKKLKAIE